MTVVDSLRPRAKNPTSGVSILVLVDDGRRRPGLQALLGVAGGFNPCSCG